MRLNFLGPERGGAATAVRTRIVAVTLAAIIACAGLGSTAFAAERLLHVGIPGGVDSVRVTHGKSQTLRTEGSFVDLVVGDPEVADVVPLTDHSLYVLGKKIGATNVTVYDAKKVLVGVIEVEVSHEISRLQDELRRRLPGSMIQVSSTNGRIMLSGTARDAPTVERAVTIARQFGPDVINSLTVGSAQQVMLEVRFVEAARSAGRDLGINFGIHSKSQTFTPGTGIGPGTIGQPTSANTGGVFGGTEALLSGGNPFGVVVAKLLSGGVNADVLIRGLEEKGVARRLAEPNLVAMSGDTASFLAGGEYPIPVSNDKGNVTITYKQYGVSLTFTPTVLDHGQINVKFQPEVSELDYSNPLVVGGVSVPGLVVRRTSTTIELRDGQSFAVAGLLQNSAQSNIQQYPWLGSVPILGALFRSSSFQQKETELVIIVTPRLVQPVAPGQVLKTPMDTAKQGNDIDVFVDGRGELTAEQLRFIEKGGTTPNLTGHILDAPTRTASIKKAKQHVSSR